MAPVPEGAAADFVDDVPKRLAEAYRQVHQSAWTHLVSACLVDLLHLTRVQGRPEFLRRTEALAAKLHRFEAVLAAPSPAPGPFWHGTAPGAVDASLAPLLLRLRALEDLGLVLLDERFPRLAALADLLLCMPEVQAAVVPDWRALHEAYLRRHGGVLHGIGRN